MRRSKNAFTKALNVSMPTLVVFFSLSMVFGVLFLHTEQPWFYAPIISGLVYAGTVQFATLTMLHNHEGLVTIFIASLLITSRTAFYGFSVKKRFAKAPRWMLPILVFGLMDAAYVIFCTEPEESHIDDGWFCFFTVLLMWITWVFGTFIGACFGNIIPRFNDMEFILVCFFFIMVLKAFEQQKALDALIIPIVFSFFSWWLWPSHYLMLAIVLCVIYIQFKQKRMQ